MLDSYDFIKYAADKWRDANPYDLEQEMSRYDWEDNKRIVDSFTNTELVEILFNFLNKTGE